MDSTRSPARSHQAGSPPFIGQGGALLAATAEQGLGGVVAKRLDAPYAERRRSRAWVEQNHRRKLLELTGWREPPRRAAEFLLARRGGDGGLRPAGSAGPAWIRPVAGCCWPRSSNTRCRRGRGGRVRSAAPVIEVLVDLHGRSDGAARDAVLREISWPDDPRLDSVRSGS